MLCLEALVQALVQPSLHFALKPESSPQILSPRPSMLTLAAFEPALVYFLFRVWIFLPTLPSLVARDLSVSGSMATALSGRFR